MSLELALQENTSALHTLIALLEKGGVPVAPAAEVKAAATKTAGSKPVAEKSAEAPAEVETKEYADGTKATGTAPLPEASPLEDGKAVTYDDAKAAVTSVVKAKGRDAGLAVLAKFGAESLLAVPADQWTAVITACGEALK
jgi:hypothetical protein